MNVQRINNGIKERNKSFGNQMVLAFEGHGRDPKVYPVKAWRNKNFLATLWDDGEPGGESRLRLCVQRTLLNHNGEWLDGITWDELQKVKNDCGFEDVWMVEIFPPATELVYKHNIRHLWIVPRPEFAWCPSQNSNHASAVAALAVLR